MQHELGPSETGTRPCRKRMGGGTRQCHWSQMTSNRKTGTRPIARSGTLLPESSPHITTPPGVPDHLSPNHAPRVSRYAGTEAAATVGEQMQFVRARRGIDCTIARALTSADVAETTHVIRRRAL